MALELGGDWRRDMVKEEVALRAGTLQDSLVDGSGWVPWLHGLAPLSNRDGGGGVDPKIGRIRVSSLLINGTGAINRIAG
jgi:hypothetical protein